MPISTFFEETLGANLANSRWSWGATNPTTNQVFLRVWADDFEVVDGRERILLVDTEWRFRSNGLPERRLHVQAIRSGAEGYGVVCEPDGPKLGSRRIVSFNHERLLKFGDLIQKGTQVYATVLDWIPVEQLARLKTSQSSLVQDLKSILAKRIEETTKQALANARVGQGIFRAQVLRCWNSRCCITGSTTLDAIRASHIKPWWDSNNDERLDPNNGLPLVATLDALFDAGLITFDTNATMIVSKRIPANEVSLLGLSEKGLRQLPSERTAEYLTHHRRKVFSDQ